MIFTSDKVQPLRLKMDMEKDDFARLIGVGTRTVDTWENGKTKKMHRVARMKLIGFWKQYMEGS